MHKRGIAHPCTQAKLARSFQKRQRFNIAHRAANLHNRYIHTFSATLYIVLNFVGDVRNDLHGLAQVVTSAFFVQHRLVNLPGGEVVGLLHAGIDKPLIVAQVKVSLCAIVGDKHFAMLQRRHGAGVHVDVRVKLDKGDFEAARFKNGGQ